MLELYHSLKELNFEWLVHLYRSDPDIFGYGDDFSNLERRFRARSEFYHYLNEAFFGTAGAMYAVWRQGSSYTAALRLEPHLDGLLISALITDPEARGNGYASKLLQGISSVAGTLGYKLLYVHISKKNRISLHIHTKCGFAVISNSATLLDGTFSTYYYTLSKELNI